MQKFKIGQKVNHNNSVYVQECEIVDCYPNGYLDPIKSTPFLHSTDSYKVKFADGNTAIVPERYLSEIKRGVNYD